MAYRYTDASAPVMLYLDTDDPSLNDYALIDMPPTWTERVYDRAPYNPLWHILNNHYSDFPNEPYYGVINDDMIPRTYHWDQELINTAGADHIAYSDDMLQGQRMCTFPVIGGDLVRRVGRLVFDGVNLDTSWMLLGFKHGLLRYRPDVRLEHMHYMNGKAPFDDTYDVPEELRHGGKVEALERFVAWVLAPSTAEVVAGVPVIQVVAPEVR